MDKRIKKKIKALQEVFDDNDFILRIIQEQGEIGNKSDFRYFFSKLFAYYFATEDINHNYSMDDISKKFSDLIGKKAPIIDQRYYFHSYNGIYEKTFKKNGIDDISSLNSKIKDAMEILENELGKTPHELAGGNRKIHKTFVTTDFYMLMRYVLDFSPERLWCGPLKEDKNKTMIKIGEKNQNIL